LSRNRRSCTDERSSFKPRIGTEVPSGRDEFPDIGKFYKGEPL
jgi:hypothetical protein